MWTDACVGIAGNALAVRSSPASPFSGAALGGITP